MAKELGIKIQNNRGLISDLMKKLNGLGDYALIIFNNSINKSQIIFPYIFFSLIEGATSDPPPLY